MRFLGLLLLLSANAFASESLERRGADLVGNACAATFASLDDVVAARRLTENPVYDKTARIRDRYARFEDIRSVDNEIFLNLARAANRGELTDSTLFLDVENAVLKELNDKVVKDKDFVTSLTNLHKKVIWALIENDPILKNSMVAKYSDFKSVRVAFNIVGPAAEKRLKAVVAEASYRYKNYLSDVIAREGWGERSRGLARDAQNWFHAGTGSSPDLAGLAAKCSRSKLGSAGVAMLRSFGDCLGLLGRSSQLVKSYQGWAEARFGKVSGFLVSDGKGRKVLSAEAIETLKKVTPKGEEADAFFEAIQAAVQDRFQVEISRKEAQALSNYLTHADKFSPGLLQTERVVVDMGQEAVGVVSVDFKGQNARNLEETMKALSRTEGQPLAERVRAVRAGEELATAQLDAQKARLQKVFDRLFPGLKGEFTGDDGTGFFGARMPTPKEELAIARAWKEEGGGVADIRLTFQDFRYVDTGRPVPASARSNLVVVAEGLEKNLRKELIRTLSREELNGLQIAVSLKAREVGPPQATIRLLAQGKPSAGLSEKVRKLANTMGVEVGEVQLTSFL